MIAYYVNIYTKWIAKQLNKFGLTCKESVTLADFALFCCFIFFLFYTIC